MARFSMYGMAGIGIAAAIGFVLVLGSIGPQIPEGPVVSTVDEIPSGTTALVAASQKLNKFSSIEELRSFLANVESSRNAFATAQFGGLGTAADTVLTTSPELQAPESSTKTTVSDSDQAAPAVNTGDFLPDYSTTNVQVSGVDEPDFLKNDGKYLYVLSGDKLTIAEIYPVNASKIVTKVGLDIQQGQYLQDMFLSSDKLVILYQEYGQDFVIPQYEFAPQPVYAPKTHAIVLDITDRANPKTLHNYSVSGGYSNSRMIGDYVYLITTNDLYNYRYPILPKIMETSTTIMTPDVYYFENPEPYYSFNTVTSININAAENAVNSKTFMMNPSSTLYASTDNIYIAYQKYLPYGYYEYGSRDRFFQIIVPLLPQDVQDRIWTIDADPSLSQVDRWDMIANTLQDMYNRMAEQEKAQLIERIQKAIAEYDAQRQKDALKTVVHRIAIGAAGEIEYGAKGEVPGRLLNQFSMDESGDRFRVATTVEYYSPYSSGLYNNIYVLNEAMETIGRLEQMAKDESIFSARFMGERLYLVTFQRIDPFFVIDLSSDQPRILGELKLPGFSSYLHPYDENHVIGIGKETKDNGSGGVQTIGVKIALFDVSSVANPKLIGDYVIGGSGTDSEVFYNHKALLFDKTKNVLSIPVTSYDSEPRYGPDGSYIPPKTWGGFYVFILNPENGITLKGQIEHRSGEYYYLQGGRSFYIENVLYTVSQDNLVKMNDIDTLQDLGKLQIGATGAIVPYPLPLEG